MKETLRSLAVKAGLVSPTRDPEPVIDTPIPSTSPSAKLANAPKSTKVLKAKPPKVPKPNSPEYPVHLAHNIMDLVTGEDHASHHAKVEKKKLMKALQKDQTAKAVVIALKDLPDPGLIPIQDEVVGHAIPGKIATIKKKNNKATLRENRIKVRHNNPFSPEKIVGPAMAGVAAVEAIAITRHAAVKTAAPLHSVKPSFSAVSAYTYWWGYEIYVPHSCMNLLNEAQDITNAFLGFFQIIIAGVPMLRPYIPYISAWVGLQFSLIKAQDVGKGVVLAATWILPVAVVPRSWDVPDDTA